MLDESVVVAEGGCSDLEDGFGTFRVVPERPGPLHPRVDLFDQRLHPSRPFAIMVADVAAVRQLCEVSRDEEALLTSPRRPVVLLRRRSGVSELGGVAPQIPWLGVMLPYTPLHLLHRELVGIPLVMTSGNQSDEPIAFEDQDALERLKGIADFFWFTIDRSISVATTRRRGSSRGPRCRSADRGVTLRRRSPCRWTVDGRRWLSAAS